MHTFRMIFLIITLSLNLFAQNDANLDHLVHKSKIPASSLGLWIEGPDRSFSFNSDKKFVPASLSKIPTAGSVLSLLGLKHKYITRVYMTGRIEGSELQGDIYLKGGGDPALVSENFWSMVNELKRTGVRKITGSLYVDDFIYDGDRYSEGRQNRRVDRAYDAPVGALSFNWNSVNVFIRPGQKIGDAAHVFLDPENEFLNLDNRIKTAKKTAIDVQRENGSFKNNNDKNNSEDHSAHAHSKNDDGKNSSFKVTKDTIVVSGTISIDEKEKVVFKSISQPDLWAGANFKAFLNRDGVIFNGRVDRKQTPQGAQILLEHESKPLVEIIADMSKFSNNYVAEMLTKSLSGAEPATLSSGVAKICNWIEQMGVAPQDYTFVSPSGFSHENLLKPKDLGLLLKKINNDFKLSAEFKASLPMSGVDGTLKSRLKDLSGLVRAKTGYLSGAVGLAGFFYRNNKEYTFVFIYNGDAKHDARAKDLFDELIRRF